nr:cobalamin B12-binding domain-containing protein [Halobacillus sp. A5]
MTKHHEKLAHYFLKGDEEEALVYIEQLLLEYPRLYLYEDIITPAMYFVGELWERNEISVADEHLATAICDFVLSKVEADTLSIRGDHQKRLKALLFGVEDEQHYIGLKMVAESFKEQGWRVRYLGPNLEMNHSLIQIHHYKPHVIGLSAALSYRLPTLKELVKEFLTLEWKPIIMIGGRMARKFELEELESDQVIIIKDLNHLNKWFNDGRAGVVNETS